MVWYSTVRNGTKQPHSSQLVLFGEPNLRELNMLCKSITKCMKKIFLLKMTELESYQYSGWGAGNSHGLLNSLEHLCTDICFCYRRANILLQMHSERWIEYFQSKFREQNIFSKRSTKFLLAQY